MLRELDVPWVELIFRLLLFLIVISGLFGLFFQFGCRMGKNEFRGASLELLEKIEGGPVFLYVENWKGISSQPTVSADPQDQSKIDSRRCLLFRMPIVFDEPRENISTVHNGQLQLVEATEFSDSNAPCLDLVRRRDPENASLRSGVDEGITQIYNRFDLSVDDQSQIDWKYLEITGVFGGTSIFSGGGCDKVCYLGMDPIGVSGTIFSRVVCEGDTKVYEIEYPVDMRAIWNICKGEIISVKDFSFFEDKISGEIRFENYYSNVRYGLKFVDEKVPIGARWDE